MIDRLKNLVRDESGITALETAIILIAFVVVASVFAFTILSAGTFSTERGRQAIYAGLEQVSNSMEVYGSVIGSLTNITDTTVDQIDFRLAVVAGGGRRKYGGECRCRQHRRDVLPGRRRIRGGTDLDDILDGAG